MTTKTKKSGRKPPRGMRVLTSKAQHYSRLVRVGDIPDLAAWAQDHLPEWPSAADVALALGVHRITVFRWCRYGDLDRERVPDAARRADPRRFSARHWYFPRSAVVAMLKRRPDFEVPA